ncbi:MAG: isochorismatase family protein [Thermoplasmatales archaeon]|nr:isochorismatase family protein [Thermoplasmatales archaeon]
MLKQEYINQENIGVKAKKWFKKVEVYSKAGRFPFSPGYSALLILDMQKFFLDETSHAFVPSSKAVIPNIRKILGAYRKSNYPVIFTRHVLKKDEETGIMGKWWNDVLKEDSRYSEIADELKPLKDENVIKKNRYSAFYKTGLRDFLKKKNVKSVVVTGVMTDLCCETTARDAFMNDFFVYFVVDATAAVNEELHISSLKTLSHGFAVPVLTVDVIKGFENV